MTEARATLSLAEDYLTERRALGFDLRIPGTQITAFARFVDAVGHAGSLTTRITLNWVQGHARHAKPFSWARRLDVLRPFARYLARLDPATEFPQTAIFGRSHRRLAPHIYTEQEICDLLAAARRLAPHSGLRPATYEMIFGLIAATGLRLSGCCRSGPFMGCSSGCEATSVGRCVAPMPRRAFTICATPSSAVASSFGMSTAPISATPWPRFQPMVATPRCPTLTGILPAFQI
mgnify:CR=1 FL=1